MMDSFVCHHVFHTQQWARGYDYTDRNWSKGFLKSQEGEGYKTAAACIITEAVKSECNIYLSIRSASRIERILADETLVKV